MPSHSPYALSSLTNLVLSNYIRIRDFWNWSFYPYHNLLVRFRKNLSTYNLGLTLFLISSRLYLLYHRSNISFKIFWITLFSFQSTNSYWIIWWTLKIMSKWRWGESNSWPPACKAGALPAELHPHILDNRYRFWEYLLSILSYLLSFI